MTGVVVGALACRQAAEPHIGSGEVVPTLLATSVAQQSPPILYPPVVLPVTVVPDAPSLEASTEVALLTSSEAQALPQLPATEKSTAPVGTPLNEPAPESDLDSNPESSAVPAVEQSPQNPSTEGLEVGQNRPRIDDRLAPAEPEEAAGADVEVPPLALPGLGNSSDATVITPGDEPELPPAIGTAQGAFEDHTFAVTRDESQAHWGKHPGLLFFADREDGDFDFISVGPGWLPEYPGSDEHDLIPFFWVSKDFGDFTLQSRSREWGLRAAFPVTDYILAGPVIAFSPERDHSEVNDPRLLKVQEVSRSIDLGAFVKGALPGPLTETDALTAELEILATLGHGHGGLTGIFEAAYETLWGADVYLRPNLSLRYTTSPYNDDFFGVSGAESAAAGLSSFDGDGGFTAFGMGFDGAWFPDEDWGVTARIRWDFLLGEAQDSPIVQQASGSREQQLFLGLGVGFKL